MTRSTTTEPQYAPTGRWRKVLLAAACLAFAAAALHPGITLSSYVGSFLFAIDITQSMNVRDVMRSEQHVSRLDAARSLAIETVRRLPCGSQVGAAAFTERKTLVLLSPLEVCAHRPAIEDTIAGLDWRMAWAADSHLYFGTISALTEIDKHYPGTSLVFFTDGHQAPALFPGREPKYERKDDSPHGVILGIGGTTAQPVPKFDDKGAISGYWTHEEVAQFASTGLPTLSVLDMERMARGEDVRNAGQRPVGSDNEHLSQRRDEVIADLAGAMGLAAASPANATEVLQALAALPTTRSVPVRHELHPYLAALAGCLLLASLVPERSRAILRRETRPGRSSSHPLSVETST
ncbi:MAG: VWA domain-containing protein [Burkholderiales bacterium]|nr:VWA domain-containing protein [Burkholderiales bacterium]